jgi:glycosyltransferase involved in cell wall biosynthesis
VRLLDARYFFTLERSGMRVLQVLAGTGWGGAERMGCTIHRLALEHGLDSRLEAPPLPEMIRGLEKELAIRLDDVPNRSTWAWMRRARARRIAFRPDLVHAHLSTPALAATAWMIAGKVPLVLTFHLLPPEDKWSRDYLAPLGCDRVLDLMSRLKAAHAYFGLSQRDVARLRSKFPDANVALARNVPPRAPSGAPLPPRLSYPDAAVRLLSVGRLHTQKGFDRMLKALADAALRELAWHWIIVGDGEERPRLEAQCQKSGLSSRVTFFGAAPSHGLFEQADLVLSPSRHEGMPLVPMEALEAKVPVVVSTIDPHLELLGNTEASLLPVEETEWPRWLLPLLTDPGARARLRAAQEAAGSANPDEAAWQTCERVYEQVIAA